jgi:hypothetical protein
MEASMRHVSIAAIAVAALFVSVISAPAQDGRDQDQGRKQGAGAGDKVQRAAPQGRSQAPERATNPPKSEPVTKSRPERSEAPKVRREAVDRAPRKLERKAQDETVRSRKTSEPRNSTELSQSRARKTEDAKRTKELRATDSKARVDTEKRVEQKRTAQPRVRQESKSAAGTRLQVSEQHRVRLRETLSHQRAHRISRPGFSVAIGSRVPRTTRLYAFPSAYIGYAPEYRAYRYVLIDDRICIVDPDSYEIVAIIDDEPGRGQYATRLSLTAEEQEFIRANAPRERARANARIGLALGAEIPRAVNLVRFPAEIIRVVPKVQSYRYIVVQDDIVIADPSTREVVLVIRG